MNTEPVKNCPKCGRETRKVEQINCVMYKCDKCSKKCSDDRNKTAVNGL